MATQKTLKYLLLAILTLTMLTKQHEAHAYYASNHDCAYREATIALGITTALLALPYAAGGIQYLFNSFYWTPERLERWAQDTVQRIADTYTPVMQTNSDFEKINRFRALNDGKSMFPLLAIGELLDRDVTELKHVLAWLLHHDMEDKNVFTAALYLLNHLRYIGNVLRGSLDYHNELLQKNKTEAREKNKQKQIAVLEDIAQAINQR